MQLEPGAMRELHWHATAAECAFVLKGRVRTTVVNPAGQTETNDFDLWETYSISFFSNRVAFVHAASLR